MMMLKPAEVKRFKKWLHSQGAEVLQPTNEYELIRYKSKSGIGVLYCGKKGQSVSSAKVSEAITSYKNGSKWNDKPNGTYRSAKLSTHKNQLLARDGDCCFYCGKELGEDMTIEHILSLIHKGSNRLENMALTHSECNRKAGNLSVIDKIALRDSMRNLT